MTPGGAHAGPSASLRQPAAGTILTVPSPPMDKVGVPAGLSATGSKRAQRTGYDWTAYSTEQLETMEGYWDEVVELYRSLLPERIAGNPVAHRGINLGTNNGAFQKAWMRAGFQMYGVELYGEFIPELHDYGCEGEQASFFDMSNIADATFDFAVMDRALANVPFAPDGQPLRGAARLLYTDGDDGHYEMRRPTAEDAARSEEGPPYLRESFRILKPDGAFLGIFYPGWNEVLLAEMYAEGGTTLFPMSGVPPMLAAVTDRTAPVTPRPTVADTWAGTAGLSGERVADRLRDDPLVGHVRRSADSVDFHFLPTNEIVQRGDESGAITTELWFNRAEKVGFFMGPVELERYQRRGSGRSGATVALVAEVGVHGGLSPDNILVKRLVNRVELVAASGLNRGLRSVESAWTAALDNVTDGDGPVWAVLGPMLHDTFFSRTRPSPKLTPQEVVAGVVRMAERAETRGVRPLLVLPYEVRIDPGTGDATAGSAASQFLVSQVDAFDRLRQAYLGLAGRWPLVDTRMAPLVVASSAQLRAAYRARPMRRALAEAILTHLDGDSGVEPC